MDQEKTQSQEQKNQSAGQEQRQPQPEPVKGKGAKVLETQQRIAAEQKSESEAGQVEGTGNNGELTDDMPSPATAQDVTKPEPQAEPGQPDVISPLDETFKHIGEAVIDVLGNDTAESVSRFAEVIEELEQRRQANIDKSLEIEQVRTDTLKDVVNSLDRIADALEHQIRNI